MARMFGMAKPYGREEVDKALGGYGVGPHIVSVVSNEWRSHTALDRIED